VASTSLKWVTTWALTQSKLEGTYKLQKRMKLGGWKMVILIEGQNRNYNKYRGLKMCLNLYILIIK